MTDIKLGAVEAGGTKFRAAIYAFDPSDGSLTIGEEIRVPTTAPDETLHAVGEFLTDHSPAEAPIAALGIASFGPLVVDPDSPNYGALADTPKPGWSGAPILRQLQQAANAPAEIQTDVEAAAVAEYQLGAGKDHASVAYVTVGTGIGIGVAIDGVPFRGRDHTELGHIPVKRAEGDDFEGTCPFHGDCLEGMASGPALQARWGSSASTLSDRPLVWEFESYYLAQLAQVLAYSFAPDRILFSGGVGAREDLAPLIAAATTKQLAGYSVSHAANPALVARAALGNDAGLTGAALLAATLL